jgi:hypothetical protein
MIYADSGIIMRWVEGAEQVCAPIDACWRQIAASERVFVTSRLSRLECRCKPLREGWDHLIRLYDTFLPAKR